MKPLDLIRERLNNACHYPGPVTIEESQADVARLLAAVEGVLGLHKPRQFDPITDGVYFGQQNMDYAICSHDAVRYPCPTIEAITAALEGGTDGD